MIRLLIAASALALAGGQALAMDEPGNSEQAGIGADVRVDAKGQRTSDDKGIGTQTSAEARAQHEDGTAQTSEHASTKTNSNARSHASDESASAQAEDVARARGANHAIREGDGSVDTLRSSRMPDVDAAGGAMGHGAGAMQGGGLGVGGGLGGAAGGVVNFGHGRGL